MAGNNQQSPITSVVNIPGYKITEVLGKGGMAIVYLAIQESIGRNVALKILAPDHSDETFSERFLREARIVSQLTHPNIVTIFDAGVHQGYHYMTMEYIPGKNLTQVRDSLSRKLQIDVIKQIALALDYAARKGYVHRDIKPENIMLHEDGRAILTDFGIARDQDHKRELTQTGKAIGTPYFMSPEQTKGMQVDHRSDIYSLGVVLFQAIAGRVPFDGPSLVAIGIKHISEPIPALPPGMEILQPIINKCMSKDPAHRYQSASDLYDALHAIPEAQLDFIEAKARALKNSTVSHNSRTMAEQPSVELLADSAARTAPASDPLPKIRARRVSTPVDITSTDEFKKLRRRRRSGIWFLALLALAATGYYQQDVLIRVWQQQVQPRVAQYLPVLQSSPHPAAVKPPATSSASQEPATTTTVATAQPGTTTDGGANSNATSPVNKTAALPQETEKSPQDVIADVKLLKDKLLINPDDSDARNGIALDRQWFHDKLEQALAHKDVDTAQEILDRFKQAFPRISQLPAIARAEQRLHAIEQFNTHIEKARVYLAANAVAKPRGANALEEYLAASQLDPSDPTVQQGLQTIARHFYDKARTAQAENKLAVAVDDVATGLQAVANDPALLALKLELENSVQQAQQIALLLQQADSLMRKDQVIDPTEANAYQRYRAVLQRDPKNPAAQEGLQQVQLWLISRIQGLLDKQQYIPARDLLKRAQADFPRSKTFVPLQTKIDKAIDTTYPKVTHIEFGAVPISALSGHNNLNKLAPGQTLYAGFAFKNFYEPDTTLIARLKDASDQQLYDEQTVKVSGRTGEGFFALHLPSPGSSDGGYSVELYMDKVRILKARLSGLH